MVSLSDGKHRMIIWSLCVMSNYLLHHSVFKIISKHPIHRLQRMYSEIIIESLEIPYFAYSVMRHTMTRYCANSLRFSQDISLSENWPLISEIKLNLSLNYEAIRIDVIHYSLLLACKEQNETPTITSD